MKSSTLLKSVVPAQQKRSRKVEKKLITTVTKMLNTGVPYEEISVGDIARKAGISVGGFYARFGSKESLLLAALVSTPLDELGIALRDFLNSAVSNQLSVREIIRGNLAIFADSYVEHKFLFREAALYLRGNVQSDLNEVAMSHNEQFRKQFHEIILKERSSIGHPNPTAAIDMCIIFTMAAIREILLFPETTSHLERFDRTRMVDELTDVCCAYLRVR